MGIFVVPIPTERETETQLKELCQKAVGLRNDIDIIIGQSPQAARVVELAREALALSQIQHEHLELAGDNVARRELLARLAETRDQLEQLLGHILDGATWYQPAVKERTYSSVELSDLASEIADKRFNLAPRIFNELLNRLKPSSNAVSAQKALLKAMVSNEAECRLGINGFPAEGGLFASLLEKTGLHQKVGDEWKFVEPNTEADPANIAPLWERADELLQNDPSRLVGLDELYAAWRSKPFGLKDGLMPILSVAYILSRRSNLAFYREGIFQSRFSGLDVDYLANDPRDIRLRWLKIDRATESLLIGMADIVRELNPTRGCISLQPIDIARALVAAYEQLEFWTKRTTRLTPDAIRIRDVLKRASDPNRLLLDDLPALVGADLLSVSPQQPLPSLSSLRDGLLELQKRYHEMLGELSNLLLKELLVPNASSKSLGALRERAENIRELSGDFRLNAFVARIAQFRGTPTDVESLASLAVNKPSRDWTDPDLDQAKLELAAFAQQFIRAEAFARVKGRVDKRHAMAVVVGFDSQPAQLAHEFSVTDADRDAIQDLISRVEATLKQADQQQKNIILAALAELSARFISNEQQRNQKRKRVS